MMGNFIRKLTLALAMLMLIIGFIGLMLPEQASLERAITINTTADKIWPYVNSLQKFNQWSPWSRLDPAAVYDFTGPSDGVGAKVTWRSEQKNVGIGSQEIVRSETNEYVKTALQFGKGAAANAEIFLHEIDGSTQIRWRFTSNFDGILGRYFGLMIERWVGEAYTRGLENLKVLAEKTP